MANKLMLKRGTKAKLPALSVGEPAFTTDTKELFVGATGGNVQIPNMTQLGNLATVATHAKAGTVHSLTLAAKATTGIQLAQFKATADYTEGNTWKVGGVVYTAKLQGEDGALPDKLFVVGDMVSVMLDPVGKKLGFKSGGKPSVPPGNMLYFNCMPSKDHIRLAWTRPADAEGVMIRRKTTPWVEGDGVTDGTLVLTANYNKNGANNWYEDTGASVAGQRLYYAAFPYKGNAHNINVTDNATSCKAGGLQQEYSFDSVTGTTIYDTSGNASHATATNVTYVSGQIGSAAKGNATARAKVVIPRINQENETVVLWFNIYSFTEAKVYEDDGSSYGGTGGFAAISLSVPNNIHVAPRGRSSVYTVTGQSAGIHFAALKFTGLSTTAILDAQRHTATGQNYLSITGGSGLLLTNINTPLEQDGFNGWVDQFRRFGRELEDYEIANLYNNGKGC